MSHLIHVLNIKKGLTEAGVLCPIEQGQLTNEPYVRACMAFASKREGIATLDSPRVWGMLEKWNCVSPINGRYIHTAALTRLNKLKGSLVNFGSLPCPKEFTAFSESGINVADMADFDNLVAYLIKELENCNE